MSKILLALFLLGLPYQLAAQAAKPAQATKPDHAAAVAVPQVVLETSQGAITIELYPEKSPKSVANFLQYVRDGFYAGTVLHRVIPGYLVQGGLYTRELRPKRTRPAIPDEAETLLKHRYVFINVWRPIAHPVIDTPLALCDAPSFTDDDLIMTDLVYEDRIGEIASVRHRDTHRWVYFSNMTPDEVILIKCHDTARDGRARISFHSAFVDPTAPANAKPRQSIEIRTIAFFDQ